jgi:hypothetical protein
MRQDVRKQSRKNKVSIKAGKGGGRPAGSERFWGADAVLVGAVTREPAIVVKANPN